MTTQAHALTRPPYLVKGARLAVLSPASTPRRDLVERGLAQLRMMGYEPILSTSALKVGPLYYAGTVAERVHDFHEAFRDTSVAGIVCTRGGWGSAELLPHLDAALVRDNPKPFVGYSDHTSLHLWLHDQAQLMTFYGPMVASDFAREDGVHGASWFGSLERQAPLSLGCTEGLRVLQAGHAVGPLHGGCLSIYGESLGTPYAARREAGILFLEDIGTKPYQWDRMLLHLRYAGLLEEVKGIVFGDMRQCVRADEEDLLERALRHALRDFRGPIAVGLQCGHVDAPNITLPLGAALELDLRDPANPSMHFPKLS